MIDNPLFVNVIGCCRSGTTLCGRLLERRFNVAIPWEAHFIPLFQRFIWIWGDLRNEKNRRMLLKAIYSFLEMFTLEVSVGKDMPEEAHFNLEKITSYTLLATRGREDAIVDGVDSYSGLVEAIYREYASIHGYRHYGDKSASFRNIRSDLTYQAAPNAKYIHMIRDGRDVALSWMKIWNGPLSVSEAAWLWEEHVRLKREFGLSIPDQYLEIRYEDLLNDEESVLARIGQFLGAPVLDDTAADVGLGKVIAQSPIMPLGNKKVQRDNQGKWKSRMSQEDLAFFEYFAGDVLRSSNYEQPQLSPVAPKEMELRIKGVRERIRVWLLTLFSIQNLRIRVKMLFGKPLLPLVIGLFQITGIDFVNIFKKIR